MIARKLLLLTTVAAVAVNTAACAQSAPGGPPPSNPIKLAVHTDATLSVDGAISTVAAADAQLAAAAKAHKVVMYWRDDPVSDPGPAEALTAKAVIDLIIKHRLPVCFSLDAAFSGCRKMGPGGKQ